MCLCISSRQDYTSARTFRAALGRRVPNDFGGDRQSQLRARIRKRFLNMGAPARFTWSIRNVAVRPAGRGITNGTSGVRYFEVLTPRTDQLTRAALDYSVLGAEYADANAEQFLWNQCNGNLEIRMLPRKRDSAPLVRLLTGRCPGRSVRGPGRTGHPVINSAQQRRSPSGKETHPCNCRHLVPDFNEFSGDARRLGGVKRASTTELGATVLI